ncbi:iron-siderophore ABC transporter substrate-binding protein [Nesterenkonia sp. NBAIMH1]|uniref:iron-siderophore ABC transporter substrate-binding protein n=1 Tax=Nesterenkonia sp. NBAIMH1 TaxID=2600320 RepID=UPI0011B3A9FC|nr:iron-siderophore ABC transporter substrate-binding protein [Nesterenkonia sp. NBAIMH1]
MKNAHPLIAGAAALTLTLSACGGDGTDAAEETGDDGAGTATAEHMYGATEVELPEDGELRVVALGWSDAEVALALGVEPIAVHDWLGFGEETHGVGPWAADLIEGDPEVIPRSDDELDYEQIQAMEPDLILNVNSGYEEGEYNRLSEIAPTVSGPEGAENFNPGWESHTQLIADALGLSEEGEQLVADTEESFSAAREEHPEFEGVEAVTGSKFGEAYGLSYSGDMRWDVMEELGFQMYGPAADMEPNQGFFADVSEEQVEVLDAEVAVLFPIGYTLDELQEDPLLSSLDVVEEDRAVLLPDDGDLVMAFSAGSPLSIDVVLDELPEQLAEALENLD